MLWGLPVQTRFLVFIFLSLNTVDKQPAAGIKYYKKIILIYFLLIGKCTLTVMKN